VDPSNQIVSLHEHNPKVGIGTILEVTCSGGILGRSVVLVGQALVVVDIIAMVHGGHKFIVAGR
jgi:hypothetical protein